jgi:hypothetical protein
MVAAAHWQEPTRLIKDVEEGLEEGVEESVG